MQSARRKAKQSKKVGGSTPRQQLHKQKSVSADQRNANADAKLLRGATANATRSRKLSTQSEAVRGGDGFGDEHSPADAALAEKLERAKAESAGLWAVISAKHQTALRGGDGGRPLRQPFDDDDDDDDDDEGTRTQQQNRGRARDSSAHRRSEEKEEEDDDGAEGGGEEEREDFSLPAESVTGYRTPGCLVHPNTPLKVKWDLLIGGSTLASLVCRGIRLVRHLD
jgi:hypothetical protein